MELLSDLWLGFSVVVTPINLLFVLIGAFIGMVVGIIPGFGPTAGIAILLPLTFTLEPVTAIIMLAGIYYGAMYGGSTTSILINTPGESSAVAATFDGYPLAKQDRVGPALVMQAIASFVGGTVAVILITLFISPLAKVASTFGSPEYFLLVVGGLLTLVMLMGENKIYGLISALFGLAIAVVGVDVISGVQRYTFGEPELIGGISFLPVAIGLFGIGELFYSIYSGQHKMGIKDVATMRDKSRFWPTVQDYVETKFTFVRGTLLGFFLGILPGAGATIASLMAYSIEKQVSKTPEKFGKGHMPGLVAPETANSACSTGAMVPLLTLGIPGSGSTAVLLGAFLMWGLQPGPLLLENNPEFAWGLIASMYLGNVILIAVNIFAIPLFVKIMKVPYKLLVPIILVLCMIGTYSLNSSMIEVWIMLAFGVIGFFMKLYGFSPAAVVLAIVLGPMAERTLRQSLLISDGSFSIFVTRPISFVILIIILIVVLYPLVKYLVHLKTKKA